MIQTPQYNPNEEAQRPYVQFETRSVEDRTKPTESGAYPFVDQSWAIVRAPGAKDSLEKPAADWIAQLRQYARDGRVPARWPQEYQDAFDLWLKGEELPVHGTAIKNWPPLSPAQRKNILKADVFTVEDLARANDQVLANIGMQAQMLRQMAVSWVANNAKPGETARLLQETMVKLESAQALIQEQSAALAIFKSKK